MPEMLKDYFTIEDAAKALGVSTRTLRRWRKENIGPPHSYLGQKIILHKPSLEAWLRNGTKGPSHAA